MTEEREVLLYLLEALEPAFRAKTIDRFREIKEKWQREEDERITPTTPLAHFGTAEPLRGAEDPTPMNGPIEF